jgi:carboxyl-terminal processing protease
VRREHVEIPSVVDDAILDPAMGIAYLKLNCFQKTTVRDLDAALWRLHRAGMKSLIIDLQGNPGGLLTSSVEIVDKFVSEGTIVSTRGRNPHEDFTYAAHRAGTWRVPLIVLIDGDSASASEIFAGAIRDHRRGTIVGTKSYGKGSVQGIFPLNFGRSGLRLTTAKFYSPKGHPFVKVGVQPDVLVHRTAKPVLTANGAAEVSQQDPVLAEALRIARQHVARRDASLSDANGAR